MYLALISMPIFSQCSASPLIIAALLRRPLLFILTWEISLSVLALFNMLAWLLCILLSLICCTDWYHPRLLRLLSVNQMPHQQRLTHWGQVGAFPPSTPTSHWQCTTQCMVLLLVGGRLSLKMCAIAAKQGRCHSCCLIHITQIYNNLQCFEVEAEIWDETFVNLWL